MMTWFALKAINFYQKFISPYKGFSCAHRVSTGEIGCSGYGKKVISRFGVITGIKLLNRRFYDCAWHANKMRKIREVEQENQYKRYQPVRGYKLAQGGFVDCDCGGCDAPSCDMPHCDMPSCDLPDLPSCATPHFGDCIPDFNCSPGRVLAAVDCFDFCDLPDDCGDSKKRHTPEFQEKRNHRNKEKYGTAEEEIAQKNGISLKKDEEKTDNNE